MPDMPTPPVTQETGTPADLADVARSVSDEARRFVMASEGDDDDFAKLAEEEVVNCTATEKYLTDKITDLLNPKKQSSNRDVIVEIQPTAPTEA